MIADPGHRQVGDDLVLLRQVIETVGIGGGANEVLARQNDTFGTTGRTGRVEDYRRVATLAGLDLAEPPIVELGVRAPLLGAELLDVLVAVKMSVIVFLEAARVGIDDVAQARHLFRYAQQLVDLLLVLDDGDLDLGVIENIGHLVGNRVLVHRDRHGAEALSRGEGPVEAGQVVANDGDRVTALDTDRMQSDREIADLVADLRPRMGLPDAQILQAEGRTVSKALGVSQQQFWNGVRIRIERTRPRRLAHVETSSQRFASSMAY